MLERARSGGHRAKRMWGFYLCPVCGHIEIGNPPEVCPICGAKGGKFVQV